MRRLTLGAGATVGALALGLLGAVPAQADATYSYTVIVKASSGSGVPGLWVDLSGPGSYESGQTDAAGKFTATELPAGSYTLEFYDPISQNETDQAFTVGGSATSTTVTIAGSQLVRGKVTDPAGHALADAGVYASSASAYGSAQTAADGTYTILVKTGSYTVSVNHYDASNVLDYGTLYYPNTYDYSKAGKVTVTAAKDVTLSTVKLAKNGTLRGKVTTAGKAAKSAYVNLQSTNGVYASATTDSSGAYSVPVPPGSYVVGASPSSTGTWLATYYGNTVRQPDAKRITLAAGGSATANIAAVAGATIQGKVVNAAGKPVKGASVYASNLTRSGYGWGTTDAKGHYVLHGLATGKVDVGIATASAGNHTTVTATQGKTVTAKTISNHLPSGAISVKAKVSSGKVTSAQVALLDSKKRPISEFGAPASGKVTFSNLAKGTYYVTIAGTNVAKKVKVTTKKVSAGTIKAAKFTTVKGKVKTSAGKAAKGSYVDVSDQYGAYVGSAKVSSKGTYSAKLAVSGKYTLTFESSTTSDAPVTAKVTVKKGHTLTKNGKLVRAGALASHVKNSHGKAVAGLTVYAQAQSALTSSTGYFKVGGNAPGKTQLYVYDPYTGGYHNKTVKATAKAGKTVNVKAIVVS